MSQQSKPKTAVIVEDQNKSITFGLLVSRITPVASGPPTKGCFLLRLLGRCLLRFEHFFLSFFPKLTRIALQKQTVALLVMYGRTPTDLARVYLCDQIETTVNEIICGIYLGNGVTECRISWGVGLVFFQLKILEDRFGRVGFRFGRGKMGELGLVASNKENKASYRKRIYEKVKVWRT